MTMTPVNTRTGNPFSVSIKNGCRIYKVVTINPEHPGPQINNAQLRYSRQPAKKRKRKSKSQRSETIDDETVSEANYEPSEDSGHGSDEAPSSKKHKADGVDRLRKEVNKMQAMLNKAESLEAKEKDKTQQMDVSHLLL